MLKAKREVGEIGDEDYELHEAEFKKNLNEAEYCINFLKKQRAETG
ncbi:MAG: hypothetical protein OdinLCB4_006445 [Candidatus Odinarchaeum yellowstonii]|uniref:Uncharacterized protein n=1 Tax=Odinarchaeota yellowstonii (strain LCB_4) TaxID=1841599 RepID=A0AAF0IB68_ODILC|nr:MAG: hypothetical protein OdinLCB4_006445 [Candidatus Odinarchaeum yellowstonii]